MAKSSPPAKILFMGLGASGKSSIKAIAFEGKSPVDVKKYDATINYTRLSKSVIDSAFQVLDCGGQESFLSVFLGEQAEFIFRNVSVLVWVIDVSDIDKFSTSKFYFNHAITRLKEYSPEAKIYCLCHKVDLILPEMRSQILETMEQYFITSEEFEIQYRTTTIHDKSIFVTIGEIIKTLILQSLKAKSVSEAIHEFIGGNVELSGIAIYSSDGLPVFEEGKLSDKIIIPANLWLTSSERLIDEFETADTFKNVVETNDYILVFQQIKGTERLLLTGIAHKVAPLQYVLMQMDKLAEIVTDLL
ncbi:MAG: ADP-ribosylation factor-like protein [Promethearchaeota archaeon]